jgi:acetyl-CoA synthetase
VKDYATAYREFSLATLERQILHGNSIDSVNACIECCDRWAADGDVALYWIARNFSKESVTFRELQLNSARFANLLRQRGIGRGDVVATLLPRIPELLAVILGVWRAGAIYQPLFTAFGPAAIESRVTAPGGSRAKLIVTDHANRKSSMAFGIPRRRFWRIVVQTEQVLSLRNLTCSLTRSNRLC